MQITHMGETIPFLEISTTQLAAKRLFDSSSLFGRYNRTVDVANYFPDRTLICAGISLQSSASSAAVEPNDEVVQFIRSTGKIQSSTRV